MKPARITWRMPERVWRPVRREVLRRLVWKSLRLHVLAAIGMAATTVVVLEATVPPAHLPASRVSLLVDALLLLGAALLILWLPMVCLLVQRRPPRQMMTRTGLGGGHDRLFKNFAAFDVRPSQYSDGDTSLHLYKDDGRQVAVTLPGGRVNDTILRVVGRALPPLQMHPDAERLAARDEEPPVWVRAMLLLVGAAWGAAVGCAFGYGWPKEHMPLAVIAYFVNPLWLIVRMLRARAFAGQYHFTIYGWVRDSCLLGIFICLTLLLLRP